MQWATERWLSACPFWYNWLERIFFQWWGGISTPWQGSRNADQLKLVKVPKSPSPKRDNWPFVKQFASIEFHPYNWLCPVIMWLVESTAAIFSPSSHSFIKSQIRLCMWFWNTTVPLGLSVINPPRGAVPGCPDRVSLWVVQYPRYGLYNVSWYYK